MQVGRKRDIDEARRCKDDAEQSGYSHVRIFRCTTTVEVVE